MRKLFFYKLLALSVIVLSLEVIGLMVGVADKTGSKVFATFGATDLPAQFILQMAGFVGVVLVLHGLLLAYAWLSARASLSMFRLSAPVAESIGTLVLIVAWVAIFLLNNALFSRSAFAYWGNFELGPLNQDAITWLAIIMALSPLPIIVPWIFKNMGKRAAIGLTATACAAMMIALPMPGHKPAEHDKPNVIVIGIDSLRPEYLHSPELMPRLSELLADSALFTEVYTPLARTFPSWTSMLSGLHPVETGARINLIDPDLVRRDAMMTWQLREAGYETVLATDERRFSNLDESYGFDTVFGPAAGAADFVLGLAGDFPVVNLLASSKLGSLLFPYLYNNRGISRLYKPAQFAEHLGQDLATRQARPIFVAAHFCLPHWPYTWADAPTQAETDRKIAEHSASPLAKSDPEYTVQKRAHHYQSTLPEVDRQIGVMLDSLQASGHLDNAIVVVLTDHGESIGRPEETLVDIEDKTMPFAARMRVGHGTNLFALGQNRTFMAFKRYGAEPYHSGTRHQRFFSYDLKPTLFDLLDLASDDHGRGVSLAPWLQNPTREELDRSLFLETGFFLPAINNLTINLNELMSQGRSYYIVDDDGRLVINPQEMDVLIKNKQRGILQGELLLVQVPADLKNGVNRYEWILADITGNSAVKLAVDNFATECRSQCVGMLGELVEFYGDELAVDEWPAYGEYLRAANATKTTMIQ